MSRSCLKFRGGNDDRNGIYSSPKEIISNAILFVNLFNGAVAKSARESYEIDKIDDKIKIPKKDSYWITQNEVNEE